MNNIFHTFLLKAAEADHDLVAALVRDRAAARDPVLGDVARLRPADGALPHRDVAAARHRPDDVVRLLHDEGDVAARARPCDEGVDRRDDAVANGHHAGTII